MPFQRINAMEPNLVAIWVDGKEILAHEGESLHAALCLAGIMGLGERKETQHQRGVFCGMGVCFECLVSIDGQPGQRACMTPVRPGMRIETCHA